MLETQAEKSMRCGGGEVGSCVDSRDAVHVAPSPLPQVALGLREGASCKGGCGACGCLGPRRRGLSHPSAQVFPVWQEGSLAP